MIQVLLVSIVLIALAFAGIAIKMFIQKGGQFKKSCSSVEGSSGEKIGCVCVGEDNPQSCVNFEKHHPDMKNS
ncbi:MAG: hypothetical protein ACNA7V_03385 [Bacteroidales bacterium]